MQQITYQGEHLWVYYTGHFLILLAFFSAAYAVFSFWQWQRKSFRKDWLSAMRIAYALHAVSVVAIIALLVTAMSNHWFEFHYVWAHVSDELPTRYVLAAFWEGQEGSFLLWIFWNIILGLWFIKKDDPIKIGVLMAILLVNAVLVSMLLGIYLGENKIGSNPFVLLRNTMDIPLFQNAEYTKVLKGNGLNPLLQNYWMIIHPPVLFLGFASTVIPYAFGISSLHFKKYEQWLKPAMPWACFSAAILGTGILMGGAWAYEALSFGGYWAWDPVENMSLVPWLILVAGIHLHLVAMNTKFSLRPCYLFYFLSFILVVYSSFLTRSGVLGDSSAHAFTQMGLEWQLVFFLAVVTSIPAYFYYTNRNQIPTPKSEEAFHSREFWMFIGSLVLLFSAGLMSFTTSIPVYNKILDGLGSLLNTPLNDWHRTAPIDPVAHHNHYQIWIAILVAVLSGAAIILRYVGERKLALHTQFKVHLGYITALSTLLYFALQSMLEGPLWLHRIFLFSGCFSITAGFWYLIKLIDFNARLSAAFFSHTGFGVLLVGIIFTGLNKKYITNNLLHEQALEENNPSDELPRHVTLIKGELMYMNGYWVSYKRDTFIEKIRKYTVSFFKEDANGNLVPAFTVFPEIQYDNKLTKVAASNPSIIRSWHKDIFTLIAQIPASQMDAESAQKAEDSLRYQTYLLRKEDSVITGKHIVKLRQLHSEFYLAEFPLQEGDKAWQFEIEIRKSGDDSVYVAKPAIVFREQLVYNFPEKIDRLGVKIQIPDSVYEIMQSNIKFQSFKSFKIKKNESFDAGEGIRFVLRDFIQNPTSASYQAQPDDIAIGAAVEIINKKHITSQVNPIFVIRGNQSFGIPAYDSKNHVSIRFVKIDPQTEKMTFEYALHSDPAAIGLPVEIAENAERTDYIVMEAFEYPGISLVWLGSVMICAGLGLASYWKRKNHHES